MSIGQASPRKESWDKVTGAAQYIADLPAVGVWHAALLTSPHAHARIESIEKARALAMPGVRSVLLGCDVPVLCGEEIRDRPLLAMDVVRYVGEPVALVVADTLAHASDAADWIEVHYTQLPPVLSPHAAMAPAAAVLHPELASYVCVSQEACPEPGTNVANRVRIRKGDAVSAFDQCDGVVELHVSMPMSDHVAMETRGAQVEIHADGRVLVETTTQAPHGVKALISDYFGVPSGQVVVRVPLVGGGFGGKSAIQLELLAYAASRAVGGRAVRLVNAREQDFSCSPGKEGLEADIRLGAMADGRLVAMQATYYLDCGAYADSIPRAARGIAVDCSGPYRIPHITCDALCVYTNHPYATAYRGFGHIASTFVIERALDKLAAQLSMDAMQLRRINAMQPGDAAPTQTVFTRNSLGDFSACLNRLAEWIGWPDKAYQRLDERRVRSVGVGCFWKSPSSKTDATSGALITFNADGSLNLHLGVVECGPGMRTRLAQIVAEAMCMPMGRVFISPGFDTHGTPEHWKTVASMSMYLAGNAALRAVEDVKTQLTATACVALHATPDEIGIGNERAFLKENPDQYVGFADLIHGFKLPSGHVLGAQVIGRGGFTVQRLTPLDAQNGVGTPAPVWTTGAQAVEIELDTRDLTYRLLNAWTVIDAGRVINPVLSRGVVMGGMAMGLSLASREAFQFDQAGRLVSGNLRTYKPMHIGEEPRYHVEFVEEPLQSGPYGARPIDEHGILGMPVALANALSRALGVAECNTLPLTPEALWHVDRMKT